MTDDRYSTRKQKPGTLCSAQIKNQRRPGLHGLTAAREPSMEAAQNEGDAAPSSVAEGDAQMDAKGVDLPQAILAALNDRSFEEVILKLDRMVGLSGALDSVTVKQTKEKRDQFHDDVRALRVKMRKNSKGFINPRSPYIQWWDMGSVLAPPLNVCHASQLAAHSSSIVPPPPPSPRFPSFGSHRTGTPLHMCVS